jgi:cation/acetate symporter
MDNDTGHFLLYYVHLISAPAADRMSAASFISMAGLICVLAYDGSIYLMGYTGLFGISDEDIGTIGMMINFRVTLMVSPLTPPLEIQMMLDNLRTPRNKPLAPEEKDEEH